MTEISIPSVWKYTFYKCRSRIPSSDKPITLNPLDKIEMNSYSKIRNNAGNRFRQVILSFSGLLFLNFGSMLNAEVIYDENFEGLTTGTLSAETHPGWTGMQEGNQAEQDPSDWEVEEGAGLTWVASDGGTIPGGNKHLDMRSVSNITGRAFYDFENPLPTDTGSPISLYFRYVVAFDQFEWISQLSTGPDDPRSVWPLIRFNSAWQMRSILKFREFTSPEETEIAFHAELHDDVDAPSGTRTIVRLEDKLGEPQPMTPYLVVMRYDFDAAGVLQGQAIWVNPNFADMGEPDLVSSHEQPGYDTFVNPIESMDITTYGGTMRYDNFKIASTWDEVVPQASGQTWNGFPVDADGFADTGDWLNGFVFVPNPADDAGWVYAYALQKYVFVTPAGWVYIPRD